MKNRKVEKIINEILQAYKNIEAKIINSTENTKIKNILLFLLKLLRPIYYDINSVSYEVIKELKNIGFTIDKDVLDEDIRTICYPGFEHWKWSYNDREAGNIFYDLSEQVKLEHIEKLKKYINSFLISNDNKNIKRLSDKKLKEKIETLTNVVFEDLKNLYDQEYIENISITEIEKFRKKIFKSDPETFRRYAPDIVIITALQRQSCRKKTNPR